MTNILGLDPATSTGFAYTGGDSGAWNLKTKGDTHELRTWRLFDNLVKFHEEHDREVEQVVFEQSNFGGIRRAGGGLHHMLNGAIACFCGEHGVGIRAVRPGGVKRFATGKYKASKEEMIAAARDRWTCIDILNDDHADALWIMEYGIHLIEGVK